MTYNSEATEIVRMFFMLAVSLWPFIRFALIVWAVVSATSSLARIAKNLERVVNRWDLEREASLPTAKPGNVGPLD